MPDTGTGRVTRASSATGSKPGAATAILPLVSLLAHTTRLIDVLPHLHQHALNLTGGVRSLLFEHNPRNGMMQVTSGFGLDALPTDPWIPGPREAAVIADAFRQRRPILVAEAARETPGLAGRLNTPVVLLLPLARGGDRVGILTIGFDGPAPAMVGEEVTAVADTFLLALELSRLRQSDELERDLQQLLDEFSQSISAMLHLSAGLDLFCHGITRLFGADRTSVWLHDRRARTLVLQASSDQEHAARGTPISPDDPSSPAAAAMRRRRAEIVSGSDDAATSTVTVPLRGRRRALGTIVFEGVRVETGGELDLLNRADEVGRQLSNAIENLQLLDTVLRSRRELENTLDSIAHLVVVTDSAGRIVHANKAFANTIDSTPEQFLERPLQNFIGPELARWLADVATGSGTRELQPVVSDINDPALKGPFTVTVTDLINPERERVGTVIVARDLAPQTKLEAEREELRQRLAQSEKLAALGQLVAGIAHELNNPLQGVLGHLELMRATGAFPAQVRRELQTIYREADRAAKIVRNLLVFAGSGRVARRAVSLNGVLQKVVALREPACRAANIEVVRHYDKKLPRVQSDPLLLHQVFLNMVMNAEHAIATAAGQGRIEITTAVKPSRRLIVATVHDTGAGIAPDALPRIFEPFFTTKDVGKGTGLGLAIAYRIVQDHGGAIHATNHPEGGAVFTVELPIPDAPAPRLGANR